MPKFKKPNTPTSLVIFGATGDLMKRKVIPSLYHLWKEERLPKLFRVLGVSRSELSDKQFREQVAKVVRAHQKKEKKAVRNLNGFLKIFFYQAGDLRKASDYVSLGKTLHSIDDKAKACLNKLFYLAIPPNLHEKVLINLSKAKLTEACGGSDGWTRVIFEKPYGSDLKSAQELNRLLEKYFQPEQLYLIDHYLGKEALQNILTFRFANNFMDGFLNNKFVEKISINLLESLGVENRGAFYDSVGTLRDVGQNHLLQMLALVTMDHPVNMSSSVIRQKRAELLKTLRPLKSSEIKNHTFRGQYKGYRQIKGVKANSQVETYFKTIAWLDSPRWRDVQIYLQAGKRVGQAEKNITIYLKHQNHCLCPAGAEHYQNKIIFSLEPQEKITISFQSKIPGFDTSMAEHQMSYLHRDKRKQISYIEEYEKLLYDAIVGDQSLFISPPEMVAAWRYIDPIVNAWQKNIVPLTKYKPDAKSILDKASKAVEINHSKGADGLDKRIAFIGLGKMGAGLALNLANRNWKVYGTNKSKRIDNNLVASGVSVMPSTKEMIAQLPKPRLLWTMVPSGKAIDEVMFGKEGLAKLLDKGDIIIDGGNSHYTETIKRAARLKKKGIKLIDAGVSGGPSGARNGACIMIGGDKPTQNKLRQLFSDLSIPGGYEFFSGVGAGHFVKMVHNGIEYGMMQAIAEGFAVMKKSKFKPDLKQVARVYNKGSVIESSLVGWLYQAFKDFGQDLNKISGRAAESGEGRWTVLAAKRLGVTTKVIEESLKFRHVSQKKPSYTGQVVSAMRGQFGGHPVFKNNKKK